MTPTWTDADYQAAAEQLSVEAALYFPPDAVRRLMTRAAERGAWRALYDELAGALLRVQREGMAR